MPEPSKYPMTLDSPKVTAAKAEVRALVFDYLAEHAVIGVEPITIERLLLDAGHNPKAARIILTEWRTAGAASVDPGKVTLQTARYRLNA